MGSQGIAPPNDSSHQCDTNSGTEQQSSQHQDRHLQEFTTTPQHANREFYPYHAETSTRLPAPRTLISDFSSLEERLFGNTSQFVNANEQVPRSYEVLHGPNQGFGREFLATDCADIGTVYPQSGHVPSTAYTSLLDMPTPEFSASNMEGVTRMPFQITVSASMPPHRYSCVVPNCPKKLRDQGRLKTPCLVAWAASLSLSCTRLQVRGTWISSQRSFYQAPENT